jgi:serralysin
MAVINGTSGNDTLFALNINDELRGLAGDDSLSAGSVTGRVRLLGGSGNDTLTGGSGDDQLFGGSGIDVMNGGAGNDAYQVDNTNDVINDSDGNGRINAYASYTIPVVGLSLALHVNGITGTGTNGNDLIISYAANTTLNGLGGADVLKGGNGSTVRGGGGNDTLEITGFGNGTLEGGSGNDTYNVHSVGNLRIDDRSGGIDTIFTTIDGFSLQSMAGVTYVSGTSIENLTLAAPGAGSGAIAGPITAKGNDANNFIIGNRQDNVLSGANGNDTIVGSFGDDQIFGGNDDDRLKGEIGNDTLNGGRGADQMLGGFGDDVYIADTNDFLIELNDEGFDTVSLSGSISTGAAVEVINVTTTNRVSINLSSRTTANSDGSGTTINVSNSSSANDTLIGGAGDDTLLGKAGIDVLTGNDGSDTFVFGGSGLSPTGSTPTSIRQDTISDFTVGTDVIRLDATNTFTALSNFINGDLTGDNGSGTLGFDIVTSTADVDKANALIVYNSTTGDLYYNANGSAFGSGGGGNFAKIDVGLTTLSAIDFQVV